MLFGSYSENPATEFEHAIVIPLRIGQEAPFRADRYAKRLDRVMIVGSDGSRLPIPSAAGAPLGSSDHAPT